METFGWELGSGSWESGSRSDPIQAMRAEVHTSVEAAKCNGAIGHLNYFLVGADSCDCRSDRFGSAWLGSDWDSGNDGDCGGGNCNCAAVGPEATGNCFQRQKAHELSR
ncbi:hypothetical protein AWZ03_006792 [Drosophila navojoa]|uniref:Uncharacterized protein n=1 Tax=Drosophila navojoa TaxID=7232 RepID=A0A484BG27_DRONA|nr:hypothetical protein AWZ03_006792 [Drosophila navojoa]